VDAFDLSRYQYDLPDELIARYPAPERDGSRLLLQDGAAGTAHHRFADLPDLLPAGALLVLNDARVVRARVFCRKPSGGRVELFYVGPAGDGTVRCLVRASRRPREGATLTTLRGDLPVHLVTDEGGGRFRVQVPGGDAGVHAFLEAAGDIPLPPYLRRDSEALDAERYQTVYAANPGAVAAPTAGLHFTPALLAALGARGFETASLTLHVGPGTFRPIETDDVRQHPMEGERYELPEATVAAILRAKAAGRPVVAIGTTTVRVLESVARDHGRLVPGLGVAEGFILPGHRFQVVEHLVTNFHLPGSTLLLLVSALAGRERVLAAYREAVALGYRFYSYGDAMLLRGPFGG
jgi:S-adenosylmethionine:tRNA ribosyltransferase-isomerase